MHSFARGPKSILTDQVLELKQMQLYDAFKEFHNFIWNYVIKYCFYCILAVLRGLTRVFPVLVGIPELFGNSG